MRIAYALEMQKKAYKENERVEKLKRTMKKAKQEAQAKAQIEQEIRANVEAGYRAKMEHEDKKKRESFEHM